MTKEKMTPERLAQIKNEIDAWRDNSVEGNDWDVEGIVSALSDAYDEIIRLAAFERERINALEAVEVWANESKKINAKELRNLLVKAKTWKECKSLIEKHLKTGREVKIFADFLDVPKYGNLQDIKDRIIRSATGSRLSQEK